MKNRTPGIAGPAGLVTMSALFIVGLLALGLSICFTENRTYRIGRLISELDDKNRKLVDDNRRAEDQKLAMMDRLNLEKDMKGVLRAPTQDQIVVVRKSPGFRAAGASNRAKPLPEDPRFTAFDIAIVSANSGGGARTR